MRRFLRAISVQPLASSMLTPRVLLVRAQSSLRTPLADATFHRLADSLLQRIETAAQSLEDSIDGADVSYAQGVLSLQLGPRGTFVLNKQAPTRQIWWSSPVSGPRRFEWDESTRAWVDARSGGELIAALADEVRALTGVSLAVKQERPTLS